MIHHVWIHRGSTGSHKDLQLGLWDVRAGISGHLAQGRLRKLGTQELGPPPFPRTGGCWQRMSHRRCLLLLLLLLLLMLALDAVLIVLMLALA